MMAMILIWFGRILIVSCVMVLIIAAVMEWEEMLESTILIWFGRILMAGCVMALLALVISAVIVMSGDEGWWNR